MTESTPEPTPPTVAVGSADAAAPAAALVAPAVAPVVVAVPSASPVPASGPVSVTNVYVTAAPPAGAAALPRKHARVAYALMLPSFIGMCGLQHFYLGKIGQGVLWLFTFGLFGFGTMLDVFTLNSQTKTINARRALGIR